MKLKIDSAGRIVLPKPMRDRFGLQAGSELEVSVDAGGLTLKPVSKRPALVRDGRLLAHTGKLAKGYHWGTGIADDRDERMKKLAGL